MAYQRDMKLLNYELEGRTGVAAFIDGSYYDVGSWAKAAGVEALGGPGPLSIDDVLSSGTLDLIARSEDRVAKLGEPIPEPRRLPVVLRPEKIILVAVNYAAHGRETHSSLPAEPYLFAKFRNALVGDGGHIYIPRSSRKVDWEVELAAIIGRRCKYIDVARALGCIAGYTIAVDVSFRDLQYEHSTKGYGPNWMKGKAMDHSLPLGPWLVTSDEFGDPHDVGLRLYVNGDLKQDGNTRDMIFPVERIVEYVSDGITLEPGDVISTGTPPGVGSSTDGPYLKPGDVVRSEVERIGNMENRVFMDPMLG
ncbi:Fumarylacetoacetate hydrolase family protein [Conexivisphaera calida]|uniref:Fumarylacetoacetate hydrolase family protein n=2 Tax=Conexivisphaera calida TaxID=1874277 RepID=A0A4P2VEI0_9ARCH|nr:Fumarylacetoacetate hydrolase family protein [Conexivisphaera calida]